MASRLILPYADVGSGITPADGAQLFFFDSGENTTKDTYADQALTIPNTNPVIANAQGVFPDIWISGSYKVQLKDKNDVLANPGEWDPVEDLADGSSISLTVNSLSRTSVQSYLENKEVPDYSTLRALPSAQLADGDKIWVEGFPDAWEVKTGTVTDNSGSLLVFTDDSARYAESTSTTYLLSLYGGAVPNQAITPPDWSAAVVSSDGMQVDIPSDFDTVPEAVAYLSTFLPQLAGVAVINLETGFEWTASDNLEIENIDLRMIRISSADATVSVAAGYTGNVMTAERAVCPQWDILLDMTTLGGVGINLVQQSDCYVGPNIDKGVINAGSTAAFVNRLSRLYAHQADFHGAATYGIFADHNSDVYARHVNASGCLTNAKIRASSRASFGKFGTSGVAANLSGATGTGVEGNGIYAERGSIVEANGANITGCNNRGIRASEGSIVIADNSTDPVDVSNSVATGILAEGNSRVYASSVVADSCPTAVSASGASFVNVKDGTLTNSTLSAILTADTADIDAQGANLGTGSTQPARVQSLGGTITETNIVHEYRKATIVVDSNDGLGVFTTNEKVRVRMGLDTNITMRITMQVRFSAGKTSGGSGRGGAVVAEISAGVNTTSIVDSTITGVQLDGFVIGDIAITSTGADGEFDVEISNPNTANSDDWNWTIEIITNISAGDLSNRTPNLKFVEAAVEL